MDRAKVLTEDLLEVVRAEWAKAKAIMDQQQMELQQAQAQYAAYNAYNVSSGHMFSFCARIYIEF